MKTKPSALRPAERNKRLVERLEALQAKQRLRLPPRRTGRIPSEAQSAKRASVLADWKECQRRMSPTTRARWLASTICLQALRSRRRSLHKEVETAWVLRMMRDMSGTQENPPARTRETGKTIRALDRAEVLLLRLVVRGVEREAQKQASEQSL